MRSHLHANGLDGSAHRRAGSPPEARSCDASRFSRNYAAMDCVFTRTPTPMVDDTATFCAGRHPCWQVWPCSALQSRQPGSAASVVGKRAARPMVVARCRPCRRGTLHSGPPLLFTAVATSVVLRRLSDSASGHAGPGSDRRYSTTHVASGAAMTTYVKRHVASALTCAARSFMPTTSAPAAFGLLGLGALGEHGHAGGLVRSRWAAPRRRAPPGRTSGIHAQLHRHVDGLRVKLVAAALHQRHGFMKRDTAWCCRPCPAGPFAWSA